MHVRYYIHHHLYSIFLYVTRIFRTTISMVNQYQKVFGAFIFAVCCRLLRSSNVFFVFLNVLSFLTFTYDKFSSRQSNKYMRISEMTLFSMSLGGGWVGGVIAMVLFTHKLRKSSFMFIMLLIVSLDLALSFSVNKIF